MQAPLNPIKNAILNSPLTVEAELGLRAIAVNLGGEKRYVTACAIRFRFGDGETREVDEGFEFDGPSIPRPFWWIAGLSPADIDTALPSCIHDWGCDHPHKIPRDLADAMFRVGLGPLTIVNTTSGQREQLPGAEPWRRNVLYCGVRYWSHRSGAVD